jgi:hypothetical protein
MMAVVRWLSMKAMNTSRWISVRKKDRFLHRKGGQAVLNSCPVTSTSA